MNNIADLSEQRFDKWLVIGEMKDIKRLGYKNYWFCRCDCGTEKYVYELSLENGSSKSCGCSRKETMTNKYSNSLIGQRFGKLTVLAYDHSKGGIYWKCLCDCGNEIILRTSALKQDNTSSCGCSRVKNLIGVYKKNLEGLKVGKLLVISKAERPINIKNKSYYYLCKCDCGNEIITRSSELRNGTTRSCGCLIKDVMRELNCIGFGEASFNNIYKSYKYNAKKRNLDFKINKEQFKETINKNCFYCGCKPSQIYKNYNNNGDYIYNGIDRLDNKEGYIFDNVVPCCGVCNHAKHILNKEEFCNWIIKVYENLKRSEII